MRFLLEPEGVGDLEQLVAAGQAVHDAGLDGLLLARTPLLADPLVAAGALAARVPDVLVAAEVTLDDRHPLELAEQAAVTDLVSGGRLVLVVRREQESEQDYGELLDLLRLAFAARPFRFEGRRWRVPANLPENVHNVEERVRVMPEPAQVRLELWGAGDAAPVVLQRGLGLLVDRDGDAEETGQLYAHQDGAALIGAPRARRERADEPDALVARLRDGRRRFGQDWAVVSGGADAAWVIGTQVRPRVQLDRLPPGLEEYWAAHGSELAEPGR